MFVSFSKRSEALEIMDDLSFADDVIFQTLRELDFINQWLGGNAVTLNALKKLWSEIPQNQNTIVADLGCGSGEMLRLIARRASKENRIVELAGIDANPHVIKYAQEKSLGFDNLKFESLNIFGDQFQQQRFDIIMATLFLHHFSDDELVNLFKSLKNQTKTGIIINDIHRHPLAYYPIKWLTSLFSKSSMVKFDAPLSVLRAFKASELRSILKKAGIENYQLQWKWAFRWQLVIYS